LYTIIEKHEGEIEELKNKNSELQRKLKTAIDDNSFKEKCLITMEQRIDILENENIELKNRILEYSTQLIKPKKMASSSSDLNPDDFYTGDPDPIFISAGDFTNQRTSIHADVGMLHDFTNRYINISRMANFTIAESNNIKN